MRLCRICTQKIKEHFTITFPQGALPTRALGRGKLERLSQVSEQSSALAPQITLYPKPSLALGTLRLPSLTGISATPPATWCPGQQQRHQNLWTVQMWQDHPPCCCHQGSTEQPAEPTCWGQMCPTSAQSNKAKTTTKNN